MALVSCGSPRLLPFPTSPRYDLTPDDVAGCLSCLGRQWYGWGLYLQGPVCTSVPIPFLPETAERVS